MRPKLDQEIRQSAPFASLEEEVFLSLQLTSRMVMDPWQVFLKTQAGLTPSQYNTLRILRGARPKGLTCGEIAERLVTRDPDVTRIVDRLARKHFVSRERDVGDRRIVRVFVDKPGLEALAKLDRAVKAMPSKLLGSLGGKKLRVLCDLLAETRARLGTFP